MLTRRSGLGMVIVLVGMVSKSNEKDLVQHTITRSRRFEVRKARVIIRRWSQRRKQLANIRRQVQEEPLCRSDASSRQRNNE